MALASFPVTLSCSHSVRDWGDRRRDLATNPVVNLIREAAVADQVGDAGQLLVDLRPTTNGVTRRATLPAAKSSLLEALESTTQPVRIIPT